MAAPFTIYVTQSAHTDIGYTHPQEQIGWMYVDYYDRVLELCARDEDAPPDRRFKWTCETAWQVRNYLSARPERLEDFLRYVRNGQIEMTACYLHFTDLIDAEAYQYSLRWAVEFCRDHGLPLRCAMHSDINGWPWALPDLLAEQGITYFSSQVHIDSATDPLGRRGSLHYHWLLEQGDALRPDAPIRIPQAFWWQGPAGSKILHWLNEHYMLGNFLGLSGTRGFALEKSRYFWESDRTTVEELYTVAEREVPRYVARLQRDGYPYHELLICSSGFFVDNSAPDDRWCRIIARWNEEHDDIRLRTATLGEWFDHLLTLDSGNWPTYQVAWPDHWAHGLGTMSSRIAQARRVQRSRDPVNMLVAQSESRYAADHLLTARDQELFALEHTFNAWMTTEIPNAEPISFLQAAKELTFQRAELHYHEAVAAALRVLTPAGGDQPTLYVPSKRNNALHTVEFTGADRNLDPDRQALVGDDGQVFRFQRESHRLEMPRYLAVLPTSAEGMARFRLADWQGTDDQTSAQPVTRLESSDWRLQVDPESGGLLSLVESADGRDWVGAQPPYHFGQLVHETIVHPLGRMAAGNRARMSALGVASETIRPAWIDAPIFERITPTMDAMPSYLPGDVFDTLQFTGSIGDLGQVEVNWRLYHRLPLVELVLDWDKKWNDLPEAAYVAFPFAARDAQLRLEAAGGFFQPGSHDAGGQLAGTCSSYYTIQRAAQIQDGADAALLWLPLDAPLVMTQEIDYNRWETDPWAWNGFLASMPINHYWHTNFASSQRGWMRFRYRFFSPRSAPDLESAIRAALPVEAFGWR